MAQGYYKIEVDPCYRHTLAFITRYGLFVFVRMPIGTRNSPATFQRVIQLVLQGLNWTEYFAYLDDVIVLGQNSIKKCYHFQKELQFVVRLVTEKGVSVTSESVKCMVEWPTSKCKKDL